MLHTFLAEDVLLKEVFFLPLLYCGREISKTMYNVLKTYQRSCVNIEKNKEAESVIAPNYILTKSRIAESTHSATTTSIILRSLASNFVDKSTIERSRLKA